MDADLLELMSPAFDARGVTSVSRRPYAYATSCPLEEVEVDFDDGGRASLILKDLAWNHLFADARRSKPRFLHDPRREVTTHLRVLASEGIGPRCYGAVCGVGDEPQLLLEEKVAGVELWQVGELEVWEDVARWLAGFHARFAGQADTVRDLNPHLLRYDGDWFRLWWRRADLELAASDDPQARQLAGALICYDAVVDRLASLPATLVHGELYPSNVLVVGSGRELRVCPVDWEMSATGPGILDLAALIGGWDARSQARLVAAYGAASGADLDACRLHLALQWLGWSSSWVSPVEHAHDWIGEALEMALRLGL